MKRLECPLCDFTVPEKDHYFLQLHFEQVHTKDSPFIIQDDPEPLPPSLPYRPAPTCSNEEDPPSSDSSDDTYDSEDSDDSEEEEEGTISSSSSDCDELVSPSDCDDHIEHHGPETLSFDKSTTKYHSQSSSSAMDTSSSAHRLHRRRDRSASVEHNAKADALVAVEKADIPRHKPRKRRQRHRRNTNDSEKTTISRSIVSFNPFSRPGKKAKPPTKSARLGKEELGEYAYEKRMPKWLHDQLSAGPKVTTVNRIGRDGRLIKYEQVQNETPGIIPILAQLSALDRTVQQAYYCHPSTLHVGKTPNEGSFCGYRNIHMLLSYIQGAKAQGHEEFPGRLPTILKIQDLIEEAWDNGINEVARVQTGGIRNTRKYIGTPEAQAFFLNADINCAVEVFGTDKDRRILAYEVLLPAIERYFARAAVDDGSTVCKTLLPPIYLQQPGHSLTIVGFERHYDGTCNLVVFDPMYSTRPPMHKLLGRKNIKTARPEVLHEYRHGRRSLKKFDAFEILMLTATPPLFPAWGVLRQFPDCRFVFVFFRARSLGYDVYPEDYFLPTFPWQQYGGLWSCDDARFARADPMDTLTAQALRRITGQGTSVDSSNGSNPASLTSLLNTSSFQHTVAIDGVRPASWTNAFDKAMSNFDGPSQSNESAASFNMGSLSKSLPQPKALKPHLSLLTEVGRKFPGFPTPLSPTLSARELFPSPNSDVGGTPGTPCALSPGMCSISPGSIDGSERCSPSCRCGYHSYRQCASPMDSIDNVLTRQVLKKARNPSAPSRSTPAVITPPVSPPGYVPTARTISREIMGNPNSQEPSNSAMDSGPKLEFHPSARNLSVYPASPLPSTRSPSVTHAGPSLSGSIRIGNGVEFETVSPLDPSGTMLMYASNRSVDCGLLGVCPLSELQVAEYRFWRPCGRRNCSFGCGSADMGEAAAAKRLFRDVEDISLEYIEEQNEEQSATRKGDTKKRGPHDFGIEEQNDRSSSGESGRDEQQQVEESLRASIWAGRRLVTDWTRFLQGCEREGVAPF